MCLRFFILIHSFVWMAIVLHTFEGTTMQQQQSTQYINKWNWKHTEQQNNNCYYSDIICLQRMKEDEVELTQQTNITKQQHHTNKTMQNVKIGSKTKWKKHLKIFTICFPLFYGVCVFVDCLRWVGVRRKMMMMLLLFARRWIYMRMLIAKRKWKQQKNCNFQRKQWAGQTASNRFWIQLFEGSVCSPTQFVLLAFTKEKKDFLFRNKLTIKINQMNSEIEIDANKGNRQ